MLTARIPASPMTIPPRPTDLDEWRKRRDSSLPPPAITRDQAEKLIVELSELALKHVSAGELDEARRTVGDAVVLFEDVKEPAIIGRASMLLAETMLLLDAPLHAKPRFETALAIFEGFGDARWAARARVGIGRAMLALDDPAGDAVLEDAGRFLATMNDDWARERIDAALREAHSLSDTPRVGYGRPVSVPPPKR
jgi:hypothetical protein